MYLFRNVDSKGNTINVYLHKIRKCKTAKSFLRKLCGLFIFKALCYLTVDKKPVYPMNHIEE
ncbi:DDE-type integrase/transposase/recombinase [Priestia megaterium]|uniref:DDE-type integrase/transposase/recombinase n=1 Tax=Priestia megaterium TaxID=1404 RepID=UPI003557A6F6